MRRPTPTVSALLALLAAALAPAAHAAPLGLHGRLAAAGASSNGAARVAGPLVALWQEPAPGTAADPAFTLRAEELRIERDRADLAVANPVERIRFPHTEVAAPLHDAVATGTANAPGYRWTLLATDPSDPPTLSAAGPCAQARPPAQDALVRRPLVDLQRGDAVRDLAAAVGWTCLDGAAVEVAGNFTLSLWAWNATVTARDGGGLVATGDAPAAQPGTEAARAGVSSETEAYLVATRATLRIAALSGGGALLYTEETRLASTGLLVRQATGRLDAAGHPLDLRGGTLELDGAPAATLRGNGAGRPLVAELAGAADRLAVDGATVPLVAPFHLGVAPVAWTLAAAVAAGLVAEVRRARLAHGASWGDTPLLAPPLTWRERRGTGHWMLARRAAAEGHARAARRHTRRALRWFPDSTDARLLEAALLVKGADYTAALCALDEVHRLLPDGPAGFEVAAMASSSAMLADRPTEAVAWLRRAAAADPLAFTQEVHKPIYDPLAADDWVRAARSGLARLVGDGADPAFS